MATKRHSSKCKHIMYPNELADDRPNIIKKKEKIKKLLSDRPSNKRKETRVLRREGKRKREREIEREREI